MSIKRTKNQLIHMSMNHSSPNSIPIVTKSSKKSPNTSKPYHHIVIRAIIFFILVYGFVPLVFYLQSEGAAETQTYQLGSFMVYTLILVVYFGIHHRDDLVRLKTPLLRPQAFIFYTLALIMFSIAFYLQFHTAQFSSWLFAIATILYLCGAWCISVALFNLAFYKERITSLFFFTILMYFFFIITEILRQLWHTLSLTTGKGSAFLLSLFFKNINLTIQSADPTLKLNNFSVIIGPACSGVESLSLFIGLFVMLLVYEGENINKYRAVIIFLLGLLGTYLLNIIRVSLIMIVGSKYPNFGIGLFHSQIGWILFSIFILILLYLSYSWMKNPQVVHKG